MKKYSRINEKERCLIEAGIKTRKSIREIGRMIGRPAKTVSAEIKRHGGKIGYYAVKADFCAREGKLHRRGRSKIEDDGELKKYVIEKIIEGWSPDVIAATWNAQKKKTTITRETIYVWIYKYKQDLICFLPRKKKKRGGIKTRKNKGKIKDRTSIHVRSDEINKRERLGDYEFDTVYQKGYQSQNFVTAVERKSRMVTIKKNNSKHADNTIELVLEIQKKAIIPMKTATFDNGLEFARHMLLNIPTYFCDPGCPYQKGAIENVNGIIRRHIDYRLNPDLISQEMLDAVAHKINSTPRKILGYLTPYQAAEKYKNMEKTL